MCNVLVWSLDVLTTIRWLEVISAFAALATAIIAFSALKSWKRQDKAKKEAEFLEELIESVHKYLAEMPTIVTLFEMDKIGMDSHAPTWEEGDNTVKGAIAYIQKYGKEESLKLRDALQNAQPSLIRLRSLVVKGQVFRFERYTNCQQAVAMLTWQFDRVAGFVPLLGSTSSNWEQPEILRLLKGILAIDPNDIRNLLQENEVVVLKFVGDTYKRIYG